MGYHTLEWPYLVPLLQGTEVLVRTFSLFAFICAYVLIHKCAVSRQVNHVQPCQVFRPDSFFCQTGKGLPTHRVKHLYVL